MKLSRIRPVALAVPMRGEDVLVFQYSYRSNGHTFCRPLGGGIEYGETALEAVHRELNEEIGAELADVTLLGVLENIFDRDGVEGHEVVFVFGCRLADASLYERDEVGVVSDDGSPVSWKPLSSFGPHLPLYPNGLAELLSRSR
ncbi:NUDIX hydrolase [Longispora albida]|uniref:NUDIX hydrolase n=1 Tax=Longispora albida TaxID=203523 RepID=UPI0003659A89|nr:NUDIX domain-containing protein [Longispora albida]